MKDEILGTLTEYLKLSGDFIIAESPIVIQQALEYHFINSLLGLILCSALFLLSMGVFYYFYMNPTFDKYGSRELSTVLPLFFSGMGIFIFLIFSIGNADTLIKVCIAPKYFLINLFL